MKDDIWEAHDFQKKWTPCGPHNLHSSFCKENLFPPVFLLFLKDQACNFVEIASFFLSSKFGERPSQKLAIWYEIEVRILKNRSIRMRIGPSEAKRNRLVVKRNDICGNITL